jgi:hypothetical protein
LQGRNVEHRQTLRSVGQGEGEIERKAELEAAATSALEAYGGPVIVMSIDRSIETP